MKVLPRLPHVAKALLVSWAVAACGGGAGGQLDSGPPGGDADGDAHRDAAVEADSSAAEDSGTDSGTLEYPVCDPQFHDLPWGHVGGSNLERSDVEHEFVVTRVLEMGFIAELDPERELGDEPRMSVSLPPDMAANVQLPELGEAIIALGGPCDEGTYSGYFRVTTPSGELIYEGGAPWCTSIPDGFPWPMPPRLSQRDVPSERCTDYWNNPPPPPEFCCVTRTDMEVVLHQPDGDSVVVPGEDREVEIDGLRYLVSSQGAYWIDQGPGWFDVTGPRGSAFIVRLADPQ